MRPTADRRMGHLPILGALGAGLLAVEAAFAGCSEDAARWLLLALFCDVVHAAAPARSAQTPLAPLTDVLALTLAPALFCWRAGVFLPGWGPALVGLALAGAGVRVHLQRAGTRRGGAGPLLLALLLLWLLDVPPESASPLAGLLFVFCWLPVRYPAARLVAAFAGRGLLPVVHIVRFASAASMLVFLRDGLAALYVALLVLLALLLLVLPALMALGALRPPGARQAC